jgi:biopolymer transport protein TolR
MRLEKKRRGEESAIKSDINVTPLVDVCLVLLIIFMVVTPLLNNSKVRLPETRNPDAMPEKSGQLTVSIDASGGLTLGQQKLTGAMDLAAALRETHQRSPEREVVVHGDRQLTYGFVRQILKRVNEAGFAHAGLATNRLKG